MFPLRINDRHDPTPDPCRFTAKAKVFFSLKWQIKEEEQQSFKKESLHGAAEMESSQEICKKRKETGETLPADIRGKSLQALKTHSQQDFTQIKLNFTKYLFFPGCQKRKETSCWQQLIAVCHQGALAVLAAQQGAVLTASEQPSTGPRVQTLQLLASARHLHGRKPSNQSRRMTSGPPLPCGASHRLEGALRGKKTQKIMDVECRRWKFVAENRGFHPCQSFHIKSVSPPAHLKCHLFQEEEKKTRDKSCHGFMESQSVCSFCCCLYHTLKLLDCK